MLGESLLLLVDRMISLVKTREENNRKTFELLIEHTFQETEKAFDDYRKYLDSVRTVVTSKVKLKQKDVDRIAVQRRDLSHLRDKLRTLSNLYSESSSDTKIREFFETVLVLFSPPERSSFGGLVNTSPDPKERRLNASEAFVFGVEMFQASQMGWLLRRLQDALQLEGDEANIEKARIAKLVHESDAESELIWKKLITLYGELRLKLMMPK
jgi:hypothetical protein